MLSCRGARPASAHPIRRTSIYDRITSANLKSRSILALTTLLIFITQREKSGDLVIYFADAEVHCSVGKIYSSAMAAVIRIYSSISTSG